MNTFDVILCNSTISEQMPRVKAYNDDVRISEDSLYSNWNNNHVN